MRPDTLLPQGPAGSQPAGGHVTLVGAGPGDPELLTLKALKAIAAADVIFHDRLVSPDILALAGPGTAMVPVGKTKGHHSVPQDEIHARMIAAARAGLAVVRLKGGDPFVFGRGGEERDAVEAAGIPVRIIPGISAALGCAASAGIPLTHRDHAQSVTFVTGHAQVSRDPAGGVPDLDWPALARTNQTLVVFMGVGTAATISARLIAAGRSPDTPAAVIENGTRPEEIVAHGTLGTLAGLIAGAGITGPALLIIGEVAAGRASLAAARPSLTGAFA